MISCIILLKEFVSLTMVTMEIGERRYFSYQSSSCKEDEVFIKNVNLFHSNYQNVNLFHSKYQIKLAG